MWSSAPVNDFECAHLSLCAVFIPSVASPQVASLPLSLSPPAITTKCPSRRKFSTRRTSSSSSFVCVCVLSPCSVLSPPPGRALRTSPHPRMFTTLSPSHVSGHLCLSLPIVFVFVFPLHRSLLSLSPCALPATTECNLFVRLPKLIRLLCSSPTSLPSSSSSSS